MSKKQIYHNLIHLFSFSRLAYIIISFGVLVRLVPYLNNRSLWADEAVLALNIVNRSYLELLQPLDYEQGAPIGFLLVEKLAVQLFGNNEYALRLFPLLCGIISLFLFYQLAKRCIPQTAIPIALALFASLHYLVYYAFEVKQYSTDVAVAIIACLIAIQLKSSKLNFRRTVTCSLVGAIAIWFSHPAVFVLAGVGSASLWLGILNQRKIEIPKVPLILLTWLFSFIAFYFISLRDLGGSNQLLISWQKKGAFPDSPFDIIWVFDSLGRFFSNPLGFPGIIDGLAILAFLLGCISSLYRKKDTLFILISPILVTLLAAYLQKYPFANRLVLFLSPFIILLIAEGADYVRRKTRNNYTAIVAIVLILLLITPSWVSASNLLIKSYWREEIKPVLSYVKENQQPGDILYVYQRGKYQFQYYAEKYGYRPGDYIIGVDDLDEYDGKDVSAAEWIRYKSDLDNLRGNSRVWLVFSHAYLQQENTMIKSYLDSIGKQINVFERPGAFVYLYDLSQK